MSETFEPLQPGQRPSDETRRERRGAPSPEVAREEAEAGFHGAESEHRHLGLNLVPGNHDDGWDTPPPVQLPDGSRLQLYKDGEALAAAFEAIRHARRRILLEVYIWPSDETGRRFAAALCRKAREGVEVYAIYDGVGCVLADRQMFRDMRRAGVKLIEFHPAWPWRSRYSWRPFNRDHRKLLVVDDHIAGVGGLNLGNRYAGSWVARIAWLDVSKLWRDAAVGIVGPSARTFAQSFARTWKYCLDRGPIESTLWFDGVTVDPAAKGHRVGKARQDRRQGPLQTPRHGLRRVAPCPHPDFYPEDCLAPGCDVACLATSPTLSSPLRPFMYRLLRDCRHSIELTMAYFAPDDELIDGLCIAARRGVRVRLMLAGRTDVPIVLWAARAFYQKLMDAGVEVYERQGVMLHQKSVIVDGRLSILGSTNLDYRSIEFNLELSAVIRSEAFAAQLHALFEHDVAHARRIEPEAWKSRPMLDRFVQAAVSRMRYLL